MDVSKFLLMNFWISLVYFIVLTLVMLIMSSNGVKKNRIIVVSIVFVSVYLGGLLYQYYFFDAVAKFFGVV